MKLLEFAFQSIWHFFGCFLLFSVAVRGIVAIVQILKTGKLHENDKEADSFRETNIK